MRVLPASAARSLGATSAVPRSTVRPLGATSAVARSTVRPLGVTSATAPSTPTITSNAAGSSIDSARSGAAYIFTSKPDSERRNAPTELHSVTIVHSTGSSAARPIRPRWYPGRSANASSARRARSRNSSPASSAIRNRLMTITPLISCQDVGNPEKLPLTRSTGVTHPRSAAALAFLAQVPRFVMILGVLVVLLGGLFLPGVPGAFLMVVLAALVGWLAWLTWPSQTLLTRALRILLIVCLLALAIQKLS